MGKLILVRHGESEWNKSKIFTGWIDIPLSKAGIEEAIEGGKEIKDIPIDIIFTSTLIRGIMSAFLVMSVHKSGKVPYIVHEEKDEFSSWRECHNPETEKTLLPVYTAWQLNERMYGKLQGLNKEAVKKQYGEEQFKLWRRSFDVPPPNGESLKMTSERTLPYFENTILPHLKLGKTVLIAAHGNSLRSIVMKLENLNSEEVVKLEIPTGKPLLYTYESGKVKKYVR